VPSLPGYGFSGNPRERNWSTKRIAKAWVTLVRRLGYKRFVCQGGDWGAGVTTDIAALRPPELVAIHTNMAPAFPAPDENNLSAAEQASMADLAANARDGRGYSEIQRTKPQTIGFALADSPAGQAAWIYDKFHDWSDCDGDPLNAYSMDEILDNIMLYWLPNRGATSARLYAEPWPDDWLPENPAFADGKLPVGVSVFPREIFRPARRWVEKKYRNVIHFNELPRGGHFAAFEQPESFVQEMRASFRPVMNER
jgi:pimeloyl-ACP methyl ester carboxylesterase